MPTTGSTSRTRAIAKAARWQPWRASGGSRMTEVGVPLLALSPFLRGEGRVEGLCPSRWCELISREAPSPGLLRNPTSPRIRLRQKAGFGGQERGEVDFDTETKKPASPPAFLFQSANSFCEFRARPRAWPPAALRSRP